jgi:nicotinamide mononucleotide adenylyltransferase
MLDRTATLVWSGRFQPFHNGHLQALSEIITIADGRPVLVGVLVFERAEEQQSGPGDIREGREANPLSAYHRREMIDALIRAEGWAERVRAVCLPRTDIYWPIARDMLPDSRSICLMTGPIQDEFELRKFRQYRARQEDIVEVPSLHANGPRGTDIRAWIADGRDVSDHLPPAIQAYLAEHQLNGVIQKSMIRSI